MQKSDNNLFPVKAAQEFLSFIHHTTQATGNVLYLLRIRVYSKKCPRIMKMCLLLHTPIVIFATNNPRPPPAIIEQIMLTTKAKAHTYPTKNGPNCEQQCRTSCNTVFLVVPAQQDIPIIGGVFPLIFAPCSLCRFPIIRESRKTVYTMQIKVFRVPKTFLAKS
jgi:hypothetical protein